MLLLIGELWEAPGERSLRACGLGLQPNLLLVLQRTHRGKRPEMMMQHSHCYACYIGKFFHAKRLAVVSLIKAITLAVQ